MQGALFVSKLIVAPLEFGRLNGGSRNALPRHPKPRMHSLHELRCVDSGEMASRAVLEEHEAPVSASIELAEQREVELGLDRCGWFGAVCGSSRFGAACGDGRFRIVNRANSLGAVGRLGRSGAASESDGHRAACRSSLHGALANCSSFSVIARRWLGIEIGPFVNDYADSTVATPRREIIIARIGHSSILRLQNRCLIEQVRTPARGFELVGFPKAGKTIAERDVLALTTKGCLSLHHNQTWSLTPS